jgi:hypothetical protein
MAKTTKQVLIDARKLLMDKGWCQGELAQNQHGRPVGPTSPDAVTYCSLGALYAAANVEGEDAFIGNPNFNAQDFSTVDVATKLLATTLPTVFENQTELVTFNDREGTHVEDVLSLFDRTIAIAPDEVPPILSWLAKFDEDHGQVVS